MTSSPVGDVHRRARSPFLRVLAGEPLSPPPLWLMRQAGRYLPEYRATREQAGGFLDLCYTPHLAAEVTLQPIRRFGFDAAILFADILVVPDALGQRVRFLEGEGPRLDAVRSARELDLLNADQTAAKFALIGETVACVRRELPAATALIGFCGAPWTVATYMVGGGGSPDQADARLMAHGNPALFSRLIDLLTRVSIDYLDTQIRAGADCVQLFDSWAGSLPEDEFARWVIAPTRTMVAALKASHPEVPVIGFPRGAGSKMQRYIAETGVDGIGCDTGVPLAAMRDGLSPHAAVQGNLDPLLLVAGGKAMEARVHEIKRAMAGCRFIFNLGHGIVPQTPPEHVARLVELVRAS